MPIRFCFILLLNVALFLPGCSNFVTLDKRVQGRLLIWHAFEGREAETFNNILDKYQELYPKIKIVDQFFPKAEITKQFTLRSSSGLGPDLMISSYEEIIPLIETGTLKNLNDYDLDLSNYLPRAISQVTLNNNLYGLPLALSTQVLCYNQTKVEQPLETLPEMISEAKARRQIAVTSTFLDTLWGMELFRLPSNKTNERKGFFDTEAWVNWVKWLRYAQKDPHFILADKNASLDQVFAEGKLAYYVCHSEEISNIRATLGADKLGVITLPKAGDRSAAPLLYTKAIVFNQAASSHTTELALQLANFLTNIEQQTKLALETESLIPANRKVTLDQRLSPIQAVLFAQTKNAVAVSLEHVYKYYDVDEDNVDLYYSLVMAGEISPEEAASKLAENISAITEEPINIEAIQSGEE